jgi:hypothetical protein
MQRISGSAGHHLRRNLPGSPSLRSLAIPPKVRARPWPFPCYRTNPFPIPTSPSFNVRCSAHVAIAVLFSVVRGHERVQDSFVAHGGADGFPNSRPHG